MTPKQKVARRLSAFEYFWQKHLFWTADDATAKHLIRLLGLHYRVYFDPNQPSSSEEWRERALTMILVLAGELYPAFRHPPKKGRPPRRIRGLLHPLFEWPDADKARLVQLFTAAERRLKKLGRGHGLTDQANEVIRITSGKFPHWRYNGMRSASTLIRRGWREIDDAIKKDPGRYLPPPASEPIEWFGKPCLPPASIIR
jgi:hypothetical protein